MKKYFLLLMMLSFFLFNCGRNTVNEPDGLNPSGGLALKFDKTSVPLNVVSVTAELSRDGYEPISGSMNILSDTSAQISFSNINVGLWHLKVYAKDSSNVIIYQGETDVNVFASIVSQVSLTLIPTGYGVGSISIFVSWGNQIVNQWLDYVSNPIYSKNDFSAAGVRYPIVLFDTDETFKMWHSHLYSGGVAKIGFAISTNGLSWQSGYQDAVLVPGNGWDSHFVSPGAIIKINNTYYLYYNGSSSNSDVKIGLATSIDGIVWTKRAQPILSSQSGELGIIANSIVKKGNLFYLYFSSQKLNSLTINLAVSSDGINWYRSENNPVLTSSQSWENGGIYNPSVIKDGNKYRMVYMNNHPSSNSFGEATSEDGINWTKNPNNPFFHASKTHNTWASSVFYPFMVKTPSGINLYYTGIEASSNEEKIGLVRK